MTGKHIIIIAEAGVNHNGDIDMARRMVAEARKAGADYVKFQTAVPELVISTFAPKAEYQKATTGEAESQLEMCKAIHLPLSDYAELKALCDEAGIGFMSTPFDLVSVDCLVPLAMDYWKIPSGEITNLPYLLKIGRLGGRVIMSTGMATLDEVEAAVRVLESAGTPRGNIWLLHCTTQYPAPLQSVNLRAMDALASLGCAGVGYSDHTEGIEVALAAAARGAVIIEKHFTLSRSLPDRPQGIARTRRAGPARGFCTQGGGSARWRCERSGRCRAPQYRGCPEKHRGSASHSRGRAVFGG